MNELHSARQVLIPRRYSASRARTYFGQLNRFIEDSGEPVEITRRGRASVFLLRAPDFERCLVGSHPWGKRREIPWRPLAIQPGVHYPWKYLSATKAKDRFARILAWADKCGDPLLVVRRGKCPLMLVAARTFVAFWKVSSPGRPDEAIG